MCGNGIVFCPFFLAQSSKVERRMIPIYNMCLFVMNTIRFCVSNRWFYFFGIYNPFNAFSLYYLYSQEYKTVFNTNNNNKQFWLRFTNVSLCVWECLYNPDCFAVQFQSTFLPFPFTANEIFHGKCLPFWVPFIAFVLFVTSSLTVARLLA